MKNKKRIVDERQEREMYKAEHYAFYVMFFLVVGEIIVESYILNMEFKEIIGELIILFAGGTTMIVNCIKGGNWDYYSRPTLKNYLKYSILTAFIFSVIFTIGKIVQYESVRSNILGMALPMGFIMFATLFVLCFGALSLTGEITKRRKKKLEEEFTDDDLNELENKKE